MRTILAFLLAGVTAYGAQINLLTEATTVATNDYVAKDAYTTNGYVARKVSFANFKTALAVGFYVDGTLLGDPNLADNSEITFSASGSNITAKIANGASITNATLTTPTVNQPTFGVFWDDVATAGSVLRGTGTGDPAWTEVTSGSGIYGLGFDAGEAVNASVQFRHGMAETNASFPALYIAPHAHVSLSVACAPAVSNHVWKLDYQWAPIAGVYTNVAGSIQVTNSVTSTNAGTHQLVDFGYITNNAFSATLSSIFRFHLARVTYGSAAVPDGDEIIIDSFDIHAPMTRLGSDNPASD